MLSDCRAVGLSHLSVFPKSQCPSGPWETQTWPRAFLCRWGADPEITSLLCTLGIGRGVEGLPGTEPREETGTLSPWLLLAQPSSPSPTPGPVSPPT